MRPALRIAGGCRRARLLVQQETSAEAALPAHTEKIVKSGGHVVEENVRQTTSFKTIAGFPDMKL
jgi:hypothetical protein